MAAAAASSLLLCLAHLSDTLLAPFIMGIGPCKRFKPFNPPDEVRAPFKSDSSRPSGKRNPVSHTARSA
jgi:hypothetical protein